MSYRTRIWSGIVLLMIFLLSLITCIPVLPWAQLSSFSPSKEKRELENTNLSTAGTHTDHTYKVRSDKTF